MSLKMPSRMAVKNPRGGAREPASYSPPEARPGRVLRAVIEGVKGIDRSCTLAHSSLGRPPMMAPQKPSSEDRRDRRRIGGRAPRQRGFPPQDTAEPTQQETDPLALGLPLPDGEDALDVAEDETPEELPPPPLAVAELAAACLRYVATRYGAALDFEPDTLSFVDQWVRDARAELAFRPEAADVVQCAAGAYLGEVIRRAFGGHWSIPSVVPSATAGETHATDDYPRKT